MQISAIHQGRHYAYGLPRPFSTRTRVVVVDKGPFAAAPPGAPPIPVTGELVHGWRRADKHTPKNQRGRHVAVRVIQRNGRPGDLTIVPVRDIVRPWDDEVAAQAEVDRAARDLAHRTLIDNVRGAQLTRRLEAIGIRHPIVHGPTQRISITFDDLDYLIALTERIPVTIPAPDPDAAPTG